MLAPGEELYEMLVKQPWLEKKQAKRDQSLAKLLCLENKQATKDFVLAADSMLRRSANSPFGEGFDSLIKGHRNIAFMI